MNRFKNPHPVDLNNYLSGLIFSTGGFDLDKEQEAKKEKKASEQKAKDYKLDWSFLLKNLPKK